MRMKKLLEPMVCLQRIKDTLSIVRGLLLDAEEKKNQHALHEWLRQIHNICSDAEDVFDGFKLQDKRKQVVKASGRTWMKVCHFFSSSNQLAFNIKMAHQIKEIRGRLDKVATDGTGFGLVRINVEPGLHMQRREYTYSHVEASKVIGRENDKEAIIKLLMESNLQGDSGKSLCVIPIVGIGGLGKTTLAKLVFNDKRIDEVFQLKLQIRLRHKLSGQKFILVLDDIWNDDRTKWIELSDLINVGAVESKIIVTTSSNSIASMMGTVPSYVLKGLSPENCLSLFVKWAFKNGEEEKYSNLVEIGKEIVRKCAGVSLAVKTLGSSLFSKYDLNMWIFIRNNEIWKLEQKKEVMMKCHRI
ncbi:unnamed protein product [Trifolium pratense]|uniref:Uncharacterized protein n=1 Tax=Trifolium pratense TaxID=57577 RepID=A0ACB0LVI8_TRIPR|nr:unnamed protein product [Trifolium pratense]